MRALALAFVVVLLPVPALGEPPPRPLATFDAAKKVARDAIYADHRTDFYCGCAFTPNKTGSGGTIDATGCGYTPRKNEGRLGTVAEYSD